MFCCKTTDTDMRAALTMADVRAVFHLPLKRAAAQLRAGLTAVKRALARLRIARWPYRQVECLRSVIDHNFRNRRLSRAACRMIAAIYAEPTKAHTASAELCRARQALYKARHTERRLRFGRASEFDDPGPDTEPDTESEEPASVSEPESESESQSNSAV